MKLETEIETLSQEIRNMTSAIKVKDVNKQDVMFWLKMKENIVKEFHRINFEIDRVLIGKLK